jgi:Na+-transporting methylmalonyl-CoA/oxaloacetate decarboxylase gamma subunit
VTNFAGAVATFAGKGIVFLVLSFNAVSLGTGGALRVMVHKDESDDLLLGLQACGTTT